MKRWTNQVVHVYIQFEQMNHTVSYYSILASSRGTDDDDDDDDDGDDDRPSVSSGFSLRFDTTKLRALTT